MTTDTFDEKDTDAEDSIVLEDVSVDLEENTIKSPEPAEEAPSLVPVSDGVIGTGKVKKNAEPKAKQVTNKTDKPGTVAIFASRNVSWQGLGKLTKGYNIVSPDDATKWLTLSTVRLVQPEEVKTKLG